MLTFKDSGLSDALLKGIETLGFETPTPVQSLVIPAALKGANDIIALAQTGTGKTAAFGLPLLQLSDPSIHHVQALVLCPTRELCVQVASDLSNYAKFDHHYKVVAVYGGTPIDAQIRQLKAGVQIIVATPGRLIDLIDRRAVSLTHVARLVLDEADEMLNMGFKEALDTILESVTGKKSVWLFSATMSREIRSIAANYMTNPVELKAGGHNESHANIEHVYYVCRADDRYETLKRIVDATPGIFGLIFCRTKAEAKDVAEQMMRDGYNADSLHGDLTQDDRDRVMKLFRDGTLQLLIATDVAARGIDVSDISHVINYGLPDDGEVYTHRSGRTGRAGKQGQSIVIVSMKFEQRIREIERLTKSTFKKMVIPSGEQVCQAQLMNIISNVQKIEVQHKEIEPFLPQIFEQLRDLSKEELIQRIASIEFNRFLSYYKNAVDLNVYPRVSRRYEEGMGTHENRNHSGLLRVFANIGELDGLTKKEFVRLITTEVGIPASALGDIHIQRTFMHFEIDPKFVAQVKKEMAQLNVNGRQVRVDDATPRTGGGERSSSGSYSPRPRTENKYGSGKGNDRFAGSGSAERRSYSSPNKSGGGGDRKRR